MCGQFRRPKNSETPRFEVINDSRRERIIRPDDGEIDRVLSRKICQRRQIARLDRDVLADLSRARLPRRAENPVDAGGLLQFPGERMFAAAAADDENSHGNAASSGNQFKASVSS